MASNAAGHSNATHSLIDGSDLLHLHLWAGNKWGGSQRAFTHKDKDNFTLREERLSLPCTTTHTYTYEPAALHHMENNGLQVCVYASEKSVCVATAIKPYMAVFRVHKVPL